MKDLKLTESYYSNDAKLFEEEKFDETSSLSPEFTGLDTVVYVYQNLYGHKKPVIGFQRMPLNKIIEPQVHMTIEKEQRQYERSITHCNIAKIKEWILKNMNILLKIWNSQIDVIDGILKLQKV